MYRGSEYRWFKQLSGFQMVAVLFKPKQSIRVTGSVTGQQYQYGTNMTNSNLIAEHNHKIPNTFYEYCSSISQ
jgi:hypothetical protein